MAEHSAQAKASINRELATRASTSLIRHVSGVSVLLL